MPTSKRPDPDPPDGYFIMHSRMTDALYFGPFASIEEAKAWWLEHQDVGGGIIPMYKTVNWNRR